MKAAAIPGLSNRNRSSFATGRWPSPRCSRHPVPGCGPQQQPTDATWLHPAVPPEPDTCPRSSRHHSYPKSRETTQSVQVIFAGALTADCGGSNGYRVRLWKRELQKLADELGIEIQVCHFPPGTSKWNTIEQRMFCHITNNWRGRPLVSREVVVNLIGCTTTEAGLHIRSQLDENTYETGLKVSDEELAELALERDEFHGEWNYRLRPREKLVAT